jgi:organic hydroperoxide reductase OsmC/OhrA
VLKHAKFFSGLPVKNGSHTDPTELIAAAHASSFSFALSNKLGLKALSAGEIVTTATVSLVFAGAEWVIMNIHLNVAARLRQATQGAFIDVSDRAQKNCLVSRMLPARTFRCTSNWRIEVITAGRGL